MLTFEEVLIFKERRRLIEWLRWTLLANQWQNMVCCIIFKALHTVIIVLVSLYVGSQAEANLGPVRGISRYSDILLEGGITYPLLFERGIINS